MTQTDETCMQFHVHTFLEQCPENNINDLIFWFKQEWGRLCLAWSEMMMPMTELVLLRSVRISVYLRSTWSRTGMTSSASFKTVLHWKFLIALIPLLVKTEENYQNTISVLQIWWPLKCSCQWTAFGLMVLWMTAHQFPLAIDRPSWVLDVVKLYILVLSL